MTHKLFEDLEFSAQKAAALKLKADQHTKIAKAVFCAKSDSEFCAAPRPLRRRPSLAVWFRSADGEKQNVETVSYTHLTLPTICSV